MLRSCSWQGWAIEAQAGGGELSLLKRDCLGVKVNRMVVDFGMRYKVWLSQWKKVEVVRLVGLRSGSKVVVLAGFGSGSKGLGYRVAQAGGGELSLLK